MTDTSSLIDPRDTFALGVCFYPEHWPRDRWEPYARQMRALGISYVSIAEFAWVRIEPRPGEFAWTWLDEAVEILAGAGLKVVLCTPTAALRRGWQTDNELGDHETTRSWGDISRRGFQTWLQERYDDLAALNQAWGAVFWSQTYSAWEQIGLPHNQPASPNPSHLLDFYRYRSDVMVSFQEEQVAILHRLSPGRWVTHNFMRFFDEFDHFQAAACLDFATWDSYPTGGVEFSWLSEKEKTRWARTGHPDLISFSHDLYRGITGENRGPWVMEQQAGQINWAPCNPLPARGAVALWTAQGYAHGLDELQ